LKYVHHNKIYAEAGIQYSKLDITHDHQIRSHTRRYDHTYHIMITPAFTI